MALRNLFILTVLMSWGTYNLTQAEVIRGIDVPRLNTSRVAGQWYMLTKYSEVGPIQCSSSVMTRLSDDSYTINVTLVFTPEAKENDPSLTKAASRPFITATLQKDTSIVLSRCDRGMDRAMVMFDVDYDSHMAIYVAKTKEDMTSGNNGQVFILGRKKTLPDGIFEKVKQSNFYKQGLSPNFKLLKADNSVC